MSDSIFKIDYEYFRPNSLDVSFIHTQRSDIVFQQLVHRCKLMEIKILKDGEMLTQKVYQTHSL